MPRLDVCQPHRQDTAHSIRVELQRVEREGGGPTSPKLVVSWRQAGRQAGLSQGQYVGGEQPDAATDCGSRRKEGREAAVRVTCLLAV